MIWLIFDALLVDYAYNNYGINSEEFRSLITKYDLVSELEVQNEIENIVDTLYKINAQYE